jgi:hypothetical protein
LGGYNGQATVVISCDSAAGLRGGVPLRGKEVHLASVGGNGYSYLRHQGYPGSIYKELPFFFKQGVDCILCSKPYLESAKVAL